MTTPLFTELSNVRIFVRDQAEGVAFYRDVLGLPLRFEAPEFAIFATGAASLMIESGDGADEEDGDPPSAEAWGTMTHFKDPSGNVLTVAQYADRGVGPKETSR